MFTVQWEGGKTHYYFIIATVQPFRLKTPALTLSTHRLSKTYLEKKTRCRKVCMSTFVCTLCWAGKIAQWVKTIAKPDDLRPIGRRSPLLYVVL